MNIFGHRILESHASRVWVAIAAAALASFIIWRLRSKARDFRKMNQCPRCGSWETDELLIVRRFHVGRIWPFSTNFAENVKRCRWCVQCSHVIINQLHKPLYSEPEEVESPVA